MHARLVQRSATKQPALADSPRCSLCALPTSTAGHMSAVFEGYLEEFSDLSAGAGRLISQLRDQSGNERRATVTAAYLPSEGPTPLGQRRAK